MPYLQVKHEGKWIEVQLNKPVFRIGRNLGNDYIAESMQISRDHCEIRLVDGHFFIVDLESRMGTRLNGKSVAESVLHHGDQIILAGVIHMVFKDPSVGDQSQTILREAVPVMVSQERLVALDGPLAGKSFSITGDITTIGRDPASDIYIPLETVSKLHAQLVREDGRLFIEDKGSGNGTFIGNLRIQRHPLSHGEIIRLDRGSFRYESRPAAAPETVTGPPPGSHDLQSEMPTNDRSEDLRAIAAQQKTAAHPVTPTEGGPVATGYKTEPKTETPRFPTTENHVAAPAAKKGGMGLIIAGLVVLAGVVGGALYVLFTMINK